MKTITRLSIPVPKCIANFIITFFSQEENQVQYPQVESRKSVKQLIVYIKSKVTEVIHQKPLKQALLHCQNKPKLNLILHIYTKTHLPVWIEEPKPLLIVTLVWRKYERQRRHIAQSTNSFTQLSQTPCISGGLHQCSSHLLTSGIKCIPCAFFLCHSL